MTRKDEIQKFKNESADLVTEARGIKVRSDPQYEHAAGFLLSIKALASKITSHHEPMRKKSYDAYQEVLAARKRLLDPIQEAEKVVKKSMGVFMAAREERQERIAERIQEGGAGRVREAPKLQGVSVRHEWNYEIVDESKIDRDFLMPNHTDIRSVVQAMGEDAAEAVGGIRVYKATKIAASRGA